MEKIAIWGSYLWGNFGDDVMGVMLSLYLKDRGYSPMAYKLDKDLAGYYGIEATEVLEELFRSSMALVIGGGGLLCSGSLMDKEWDLLEKALSAYALPIHIFSIGGDGIESDPHLCSSACRVMGSSAVLSASVRLKTDVKCLSLVNPTLKKVDSFPDVVLSSDSFFKNSTFHPRVQKHDKPVLVNIGKSRAAIMLDAMTSCSSLFFRRPVKFVKTHLDYLRLSKDQPRIDYEYQSKNVSRNLRYLSLAQMTSSIQATDLLLSSKLHLGVFGLSFGIPFISLNGPPKACAFLRESGLGCSIVRIRRFSGIRIPLLLCGDNLQSLMDKARSGFPGLELLKSESWNHFLALDDFLARI